MTIMEDIEWQAIKKLEISLKKLEAVKREQEILIDRIQNLRCCLDEDGNATADKLYRKSDKVYMVYYDIID